MTTAIARASPGLAGVRWAQGRGRSEAVDSTSAVREATAGSEGVGGDRGSGPGILPRLDERARGAVPPDPRTAEACLPNVRRWHPLKGPGHPGDLCATRGSASLNAFATPRRAAASTRNRGLPG